MKKRIRRKIVRELPPIGTKLAGKFKGITYNARVVQDNNKQKAVEYSGEKCPSMTAAAQAITK